MEEEDGDEWVEKGGGMGEEDSAGLSGSLKKKSRLHWDEENLRDNEKEAQRNPKMKIDEPKTPFTNASLSDAGSSSNGSVPHSPELPTVTFVEVERLAGFDQLEKQYGSGSESSTPRSREFERKRKLHYKAEFHRLDKPLDDISDSNDDEPQDGVLDDDEPLDGVLDVAGEENDEDEADDDDDELENGDGEEDRDGSDGMEKSEEGVRRDMPGNGTMDGDG